jgi:hypothetical protein
MENTTAIQTPVTTEASPIDGVIQQITEGDNQSGAPAAPAETERLAAKYAEAARRNQALRAKQREVKAPLAERDAEITKMKAELDRLKKYEEIEDPMELLKLKGMSYEDIIARNLNPEQFEAKSEVQKLRDELAEYKKSAEEKEKSYLQKQKEETVKGYIEHIKSFTSKNSEKYELINVMGLHNDVYETIEETYNRTGKVISDEEAADLVEKFAENHLDQFAKINKLRNKIAPITDENQQRDQFSQSPTLSNQLTSQTSVTNQKLSDDEVLKRAASFIKWN